MFDLADHIQVAEDRWLGYDDEGYYYLYVEKVNKADINKEDIELLKKQKEKRL